MLRNAARRAIGRVGVTSPAPAGASSRTTPSQTTLFPRGCNPATATSTSAGAGAPRWFAAKPGRRAVRKVKPSGAAAGAAAEGEAGKALQPIAQAWTEVLDSRTGQTYWQMFIFGIGGALGITFVSFVLRGLTGMEPHDPSVRAEFETRRPRAVCAGAVATK